MLLPLCWKTTRRWLARLSTTAALIILAISPHLSTLRAWAVVAAALGGSIVVGGGDIRYRRVLACVLVATLLGVVATDPRTAFIAIEEVGDSRDVVLVGAGFLAAVFPAGVLIGSLLGRFATAMPGRSGLDTAGTYIGWLERAILYGLFVAGAPDAAAVVIAGKSIARFPMFSEEEFAEYYLVGSLLSLGIAAGLGIAVRATLGLHPLVPTKV
jgi:hypothetical protein